MAWIISLSSLPCSNVNCLKVVLELRAVLKSGHLQMVTDYQVRCILLNIEDIYQINSEILGSLKICENTWYKNTVFSNNFFISLTFARRDESMMSILPKIVQNLKVLFLLLSSYFC